MSQPNVPFRVERCIQGSCTLNTFTQRARMTTPCSAWLLCGGAHAKQCVLQSDLSTGLREEHLQSYDLSPVLPSKEQRHLQQQRRDLCRGIHACKPLLRAPSRDILWRSPSTPHQRRPTGHILELQNQGNVIERSSREVLGVHSGPVFQEECRSLTARFTERPSRGLTASLSRETPLRHHG